MDSLPLINLNQMSMDQTHLLSISPLISNLGFDMVVYSIFYFLSFATGVGLPQQHVPLLWVSNALRHVDFREENRSSQRKTIEAWERSTTGIHLIFNTIPDVFQW